METAPRTLPERTHSHFLISHNLLVDPTCAEPKREWLGDLQPGHGFLHQAEAARHG